jgi:hypothetical protein
MSMFIHSYPSKNGTINLFQDSKNEFYAEHTVNNRMTLIRQDCIKGLPSSTDSKVLSHYFKNTYLILNSFEGEHFAVRIMPRLVGGMNNPKFEFKESNKTTELNKMILELMKKAIKQALDFKKTNSHIITFIGNTGAGKSVLINYFLRKNLVLKQGVNKRDVTIEVGEGEEDYAEIGDKKFGSKTILPEIYQTDDLPFSLVDTGGFFDTREGYEIPLAISRKLILENAQTVRVVLCVTSKSIDNTKATEFKSFLNTTLGNLIKNYKDESNKDAIYLMITRPHPVETLEGFSFYNLDNAKNDLEEMKRGYNENSEPYDFLTFLLRENGKYISVCNPIKGGQLDTEAREKYLKIFESMTPITNCKDAFEVAYTSDVELKLLKQFTTISQLGNDLFEKINESFSEIKKIHNQIDFVDQELLNKNDKIVKLKNKSEMRLIEESDKIQIEGLRINIIDQKKEIERLVNKKSEISCKIDEIKKDIESEDDKGDKNKLFWQEDYQEEADIESYTYESLETDDEFNKRIDSVLLGGGAVNFFMTHYKESLKQKGKQLIKRKGYTELSIEKSFEYPYDIKISEVIKYPKDKIYWSHETKNYKDNTKYSVIYKSHKGEDADAKIQIYVLYKNHPNAIKKMEGLVKEQKIQEGFFKKKEIEIENAQKLLNDKEDLKKRTEEHLGKIGNDSENCSREIYIVKKEIVSLEESQENFRLQEKDLLKNIENLKKEINENKDDFDFVVDFLSFDDNEKILKNKTIQAFKDVYEKYKLDENLFSYSDFYNEESIYREKKTKGNSNTTQNETSRIYEGVKWIPQSTAGDGSCGIHAMLGKKIKGSYAYGSAVEAKKHFTTCLKKAFNKGIFKDKYYAVLKDSIGEYHTAFLEHKIDETSESYCLFNSDIGKKIYAEAIEKNYLHSIEKYREQEKLNKEQNKKEHIDVEAVNQDVESLFDDKELLEAYIEAVEKSSHYLSDYEMKLAAYLFDVKVVLFIKNGLFVIYNDDGKETVVISHQEKHYRRCEKDE